MSSLITNKSCGPNSIPIKSLDIVQDQISNYLTVICNFFVSIGIFPAILRTAKVIPIHKNNSKLVVCNYRSISVLFEMDKSLKN